MSSVPEVFVNLDDPEVLARSSDITPNTVARVRVRKDGLDVIAHVAVQVHPANKRRPRLSITAVNDGGDVNRVIHLSPWMNPEPAKCNDCRRTDCEDPNNHCHDCGLAACPGYCS